MSTINRVHRRLLVLPIAIAVCCCSPNSIANAAEKGIVRFATFNVSMNRGSSGELLAELQTGESEQIKKVADISLQALNMHGWDSYRSARCYSAQ